MKNLAYSLNAGEDVELYSYSRKRGKAFLTLKCRANVSHRLVPVCLPKELKQHIHAKEKKKKLSTYAM